MGNNVDVSRLLIGFIVLMYGVSSIIFKKFIAKGLKMRYFNLISDKMTESITLFLAPIFILLGLAIVFGFF